MKLFEDTKAFCKVLEENGFKEESKGMFSNGEIIFVLYGLGPYKVSVRRKVSKKMANGTVRENIKISSLDEVFDLLPKAVSEYIIYIMDSFRSELISTAAVKKIGIGIINPIGLTNLSII
jgi:hypothetical protein